jgi:hypothetical protein
MAGLHQQRRLEHPAQEREDQHQRMLGDRPGVEVRHVTDPHAVARSGRQIDVVVADPQALDELQLPRRCKDRLADWFQPHHQNVGPRDLTHVLAGVSGRVSFALAASRPYEARTADRGPTQ